MKDYKINVEMQKRIIKPLDDEGLFEAFQMQIGKIKESLFCKVNSRENVQKMIVLIISEFRSRGIYIAEMKNNKWVNPITYEVNTSKKFVKLYLKKDGEMIFKLIGMY